MKLNTNTVVALTRLGFTASEIDTLASVQRIFHRWDEAECGNSNNFASWAIERDEATGKPYRVTYPHTGKSYRVRIADREAGAQKRLDAVMMRHPKLWAYHQGDCRGCALYVGRKADIKGQSLGSCYSNGVAVC